MFLKSFPTFCAEDFSLSPVNQQRGGSSKNNSPSRQCWLEGGAAAQSLLCISFTLSSCPEILISLPAPSQRSPCRSPSTHQAKCSMDLFDLTERGFSCFLLTPLFSCLLCLFTLISAVTLGVTNSVTCTFYHPKNTLKNCAA